MKRFYILAGLALAAFCFFSCERINDEGKPMGGYEAWRSQASTKKLASTTYQINVYSFADSDGDGWGDLRGITQHLDYIDSLGVTALLLSPIQTSMSYHGYDVIDYNAINPQLGSETDFQDLIDKAKARGIDIYMDYVLNHSGDQNPWFRQACADPNSPYRNYYVFSDDPDSDMRAGRVDNFAGAKTPGMGGWYALSSMEDRLHFRWDWNAETVTVTQTTDAAQASNDSATRWLYFGAAVLAGLYETSSGIFEITVDFSSDWGFVLRTSATSWDGGTKWGGNGQDLVLGIPYPVNNSSAQDITFSGGSSYFASFDKSMPDINYGPAASAVTSGAFKELAGSADKWIGMGVKGLRLDAVHWIYQQQVEANITFLKAWYDRCNTFYKSYGGQGDFFMVGEALCDNAEQMAPYYQGLPSNFNFYYWYTLKDRIKQGRGNDFAQTVMYFQNGFRRYRSDFIDAIKLTNHDEDRAASDLDRDVAKEKLAAAVLLTSPGKPFIYQGEELGYWGTKSGGDEYVRTPIKWTRIGAVASAALSGKVDNAMLTEGICVEAQEQDNTSVLRVYRNFARARNAWKALAQGAIEAVQMSDSAVAAWMMSYGGQNVLVVHNFGGGTLALPLSTYATDKLIVSNGTVTVSEGSVTLGAYASAVFLQ